MSKKTSSKSSIARKRSSSANQSADEARWLREQKLTAALYTHLPGVLEHVKKTGKLPDRPLGGAWLGIGLNVLIRKRGVDIELTENEQLVFDAMGRATPYGRAILIADDRVPRKT